MASVVAAANRGTSLGDCEVRALIGIWGESDIQEKLDGALRNRVIYEEVSRKMKILGYNRDKDQCRNKVKNLKKQYREAKDHNKETERGRKTCKFFSELDAILGLRPATVPPSLLDTGDSQVTNESDEW